MHNMLKRILRLQKLLELPFRKAINTENYGKKLNFFKSPKEFSWKTWQCSLCSGEYYDIKKKLRKDEKQVKMYFKNMVF